MYSEYMVKSFYKMLYNALQDSTLENNLVLKEAEKIKDKGYSTEEIYGLLQRLQTGLIDEAETEIANEAAEEFSRHLN